MVLENLGITIGSEIFYQIIYTIGIIIGVIIVNKVIKRAVSRFAEETKLEAGVSKPVTKLLSVIVYIIAILSLLGIWGLKGTLTGLFAGAGIIGIVIGFATKDILSDLLAGLMLFFDKPFRIGDAININDLWGSVKDIGLRSTKLKTFDGKFVTIPNNKIAKSVVTNVSVYKEEGRRLDLIVGVDYNTNLDKARKALEKSIKKLQKEGMIKEEPKHRIFLDELAGSSINFKVMFWYSPEYTKEKEMLFFEVKGKLIQTIKEQFEKQKINIPFPQVTLSERKKKKVG